MKRDLRGTWRQALLTFFGPILLVVSVRWLLVEPFVIPSGSMIPTLLVHDHIFVNKLAFGVHSPFQNSFWLQWGRPEAGQIVVFRFPENPEVFYVKRVIAHAGDEVEVTAGQIKVNGQAYLQEPVASSDEDGFDDWFETSQHRYQVRFLNKEQSNYGPVRVPEKSFFVMGDNRDQSNDSRYWGFVPEAYAIGTAQLIWLSCENTLVSAQFICNPGSIRWERLLRKLQ